MQPIVMVKGVVRFKQNAIVRFLVDNYPPTLNAIRAMPFPREDYVQLMQLIGYSVSGFGDLSTSPKKMVAEADRLAAALLKKQKVGG
jgi:hypothetical protein